MPANTKPIFITTANKGIVTGVRLTTANTTRDLSNTTGAQLLFSAGTNGSRVESIDFTHSSSGQTLSDRVSVVSVGRVFLCSDTIGSNPRLIKEIVLPAVTSSASAIGSTSTISFTTPLFLSPGQCLWVSMSNNQNSGGYYDVTVYGGDY
jgi:hypothetical protein